MKRLALLSLLIGILAGTLSGMIGIGGGLIAIPLMVSLLGMSQHRAHGTSLVIVVFSGITGAFTYAKSNTVDFTAALLITATAILTARVGARYAHCLPEWKLKRAFGVFMVIMSVLFLAKPLIPPLDLVSAPALRTLLLLGTGTVTGFLSGMMGVGGGTVIVPVLVLFMGMGQHIAQGTSLLAMAPASASGAFTHWRLNNVEQRVLPGMIAGVLVGVWVGGNLASKTPDLVLRFAFIATMAHLAAKYLRARPPQPQRVVEQAETEWDKDSLLLNAASITAPVTARSV